MAVARHHVLLSPGFLRGSWRQSGGKVGVAGGVQGAGVVPLGVVAEEWAESRVILKNVYFFQYTTFDNVYIFQHELSLGDSVARNRGCRERAGNNYVSYEVAPTFARGLIDVIHGDAFRRADWSRVRTTAFMHRMARGLCSPVNYAALADDLGISQPTARRRIDELREAFVLWPCHREDGLRPKLNAQAKTYFTDPVYARLVPGTLDAGGDHWRGHSATPLRGIAGTLDTSTPDPSALSEQQRFTNGATPDSLAILR